MNIKLVVLDGQGVVFNSPLAGFLEWVARVTGQPPTEVRRRWYEELRTPLWTGRLDEREFWDRLTLAGAEFDWLGELEERFCAGLAAPNLPLWSSRVPIRVLSNHRGAWLRRRLQRFDLMTFIQSVHVSDEIGSAKPDRAAFTAAAHDQDSASNVLYVDDQLSNVTAAASLGMQAVHADGVTDWVARVDRYLEGDSSAARRVSCASPVSDRLG